MNVYIRRLYEMPGQESRLILGLMSGTSLDGLDMALCRVTGSGWDTQIKLEAFETSAYPAAFKSELREVFSVRTADLQKVTLLNAHIAKVQAALINRQLEQWQIPRAEVDCIASHGQTIFHAPKRLHGLPQLPNGTLQIGDGDHIAVETGIITLSDFRQKHIAAGGEGAPLALYGDTILFASNEEKRILLNIGGISNLTYLPGRGESDQPTCTDVGPGNTLIDALVKLHFGKDFDAGGEYARSGTVNDKLLNAMLSHPFFGENYPKTTGPELFNLIFLENAITRSGGPTPSPADLIATVSALTAHSIAKAVKDVSNSKSASVYVSGGGCHNSYLMDTLRALLPDYPVKPTGDLGINPDAKEAILFALLANETICGSAIRTGGGPAVMMGKISLPQ